MHTPVLLEPWETKLLSSLLIHTKEHRLAPWLGICSISSIVHDLPWKTPQQLTKDRHSSASLELADSHEDELIFPERYWDHGLFVPELRQSFDEDTAVIALGEGFTKEMSQCQINSNRTCWTTELMVFLAGGEHFDDFMTNQRRLFNQQNKFLTFLDRRFFLTCVREGLIQDRWKWEQPPLTMCKTFQLTEFVRADVLIQPFQKGCQNIV